MILKHGPNYSTVIFEQIRLWNEEMNLYALVWAALVSWRAK